MRTAIVGTALAGVIGIILLLGSGDPLGPNPFVVQGVLAGAVYGLLAIGLVLVYKGTRVFNFAQAEFGTIGAFLLYVGIEKLNVPYGVGVLGAVVLTVGLGLAMERAIVRPLLKAPRIILLVATIAVTLLFIGLEILVFRIEPLSLARLVEGRGITLFDYGLASQDLLMIAVLAAFGAGLAYFFARTDLGLAVLATSQDTFATRVVGIGIERTSRFIWGFAALLGAVAGILYVPTSGSLFPAVMTSNVLIPAFIGAVLGGMTSLPGAFVGGVVVGLVQKLSLWAAAHYYWGEQTVGQVVPATEWITMFLVLLAILLARPQGLLGKEA